MRLIISKIPIRPIIVIQLFNMISSTNLNTIAGKCNSLTGINSDNSLPLFSCCLSIIIIEIVGNTILYIIDLELNLSPGIKLRTLNSLTENNLTCRIIHIMVYEFGCCNRCRIRRNYNVWNNCRRC